MDLRLKHFICLIMIIPLSFIYRSSAQTTHVSPNLNPTPASTKKATLTTLTLAPDILNKLKNKNIKISFLLHLVTY